MLGRPKFSWSCSGPPGAASCSSDIGGLQAMLGPAPHAVHFAPLDHTAR